MRGLNGAWGTRIDHHKRMIVAMKFPDITNAKFIGTPWMGLRSLFERQSALVFQDFFFISQENSWLRGIMFKLGILLKNFAIQLLSRLLFTNSASAAVWDHVQCPAWWMRWRRRRWRVLCCFGSEEGGDGVWEIDMKASILFWFGLGFRVPEPNRNK